jgi:hypothetical protein
VHDLRGRKLLRTDHTEASAGGLSRGVYLVETVNSLRRPDVLVNP